MCECVCVCVRVHVCLCDVIVVCIAFVRALGCKIFNRWGAVEISIIIIKHKPLEQTRAQEKKKSLRLIYTIAIN